MIKNTLLISGALLVSAAVATTAFAGAPASLAESRGYERCLSAAHEEARSLSVVKDYFINERDEARTYYLNGYAPYEGAWSEVRISCDTTTSGRRLLTMTMEPGRYAGVRAQARNVAQQ